MDLSTFFEKFDQFADAPDAVPKLRELVLELATNGHLIPSDGSDWKHVALGEIANARMGKTILKSELSSTGIPVYSAGRENTAWGFITSSDLTFRSGTIVVSARGTIGFPKIPAEPEFISTQTTIAITPTSKAIDPGYLCLQLRTVRWDDLTAKTAIPMITVKQVHAIKVRHPDSLPEQKRIVAKVDELMALCDRLERQQQERETRHAALARASLARFAEAPTPANLDFLFHPSYAIPPADLRKAILTLAVQGKLVPQDPNDEPAEELAARIAQQRRSRKAKDYPPVELESVPFEAPYSWVWVRLGNLALSSDSGWSPQCGCESRTGTNWGVLKVSAVSWGGFDPEANKALPSGMEPRPECEVRDGDFLLSRANTEELVARSVVVEHAPPRLMMSDKIVRFTFPEEIEKAFINLANLSDPSREYYMRHASGTSSSMKNVGREIMCNLPIALPPLAEQRRIVAKVEQLMALVDALETQLAASRATAAKLLAALVAELTATA